MIHDRGTFENSYTGQPPWDIGRPQKPFVAAADHIRGSVLDAGCGTGETALFFAERGVRVAFLVKDATTLSGWNERFDNVIDSGLFHCFNDEDRLRYVKGLATVLKPGGRLFLMCFSDEEPGDQGPRRVPKQELHDAFAQGWSIESIAPARAEVRPDFKDAQFSEGGPKVRFVVVRRAE